MSTLSPDARRGTKSVRSRRMASRSYPLTAEPSARTTRHQGTAPPCSAMTRPTIRGPPRPRYSAISPYAMTRPGGIRSTTSSTASTKSASSTRQACLIRSRTARYPSDPSLEFGDHSDEQAGSGADEGKPGWADHDRHGVIWSVRSPEARRGCLHVWSVDGLLRLDLVDPRNDTPTDMNRVRETGAFQDGEALGRACTGLAVQNDLPVLGQPAQRLPGQDLVFGDQYGARDGDDLVLVWLPNVDEQEVLARIQIGRASCRERVKTQAVAVHFKQKTAYEMPK